MVCLYSQKKKKRPVTWNGLNCRPKNYEKWNLKVVRKRFMASWNSTKTWIWEMCLWRKFACLAHIQFTKNLPLPRLSLAFLPSMILEDWMHLFHGPRGIIVHSLQNYCVWNTKRSYFHGTFTNTIAVLE